MPVTIWHLGLQKKIQGTHWIHLQTVAVISSKADTQGKIFRYTDKSRRRARSSYYDKVWMRPSSHDHKVWMTQPRSLSQGLDESLGHYHKVWMTPRVIITGPRWAPPPCPLAIITRSRCALFSAIITRPERVKPPLPYTNLTLKYLLPFCSDFTILHSCANVPNCVKGGSNYLKYF